MASPRLRRKRRAARRERAAGVAAPAVAAGDRDWETSYYK